jgi:ribosomal protein S18 acetylase RimI-like enzyme
VLDVKPPFRPARPEDARVLAELIDRAGEGIPRVLWARAAQPGQDPMEVGAARAARTEGGFSFTNAVVLDVDGTVAGMLLSYRLDDPYDAGDLEQVPDVVRPLIELEAQAPGSWYVNAVAVAAGFEGRGHGRALMGLAEDLGREAGATEISLIVADENDRARGLYERLGYVVRDRRPVVGFPGFAHAGDWVLMVRPL